MIYNKKSFVHVTLYETFFAEKEGFEPPEQLPVHRISSAGRSTTPAFFRFIKRCKGNSFFWTWQGWVWCFFVFDDFCTEGLGGRFGRQILTRQVCTERNSHVTPRNSYRKVLEISFNGRSRFFYDWMSSRLWYYIFTLLFRNWHWVIPVPHFLGN